MNSKFERLQGRCLPITKGKNYLAYSELTQQTRRILICRNRTCHQQGADAVRRAFEAELLEDTAVLENSHCLGQCGSGPMVLILPDEIWYSHVQPKDVPQIIEQHLWQGRPVREKLSRESHPDLVSQQWVSLIRAVVGLMVLSMLSLLALGIYRAWPKLLTEI